MIDTTLMYLIHGSRMTGRGDRFFRRGDTYLPPFFGTVVSRFFTLLSLLRVSYRAALVGPTDDSDPDPPYP